MILYIILNGHRMPSCKYILVKCKLHGPTEMIENASAIFEKKKEKKGAFQCLNEICLINEFR